MTAVQLHHDEIAIDPEGVRRLVDRQFPQWRHLELRQACSPGTDNRIFRLGDDLCLRLPRRPAAAEKIEKEVRWLPHFAQLPLQTPRPVAKGNPTRHFPFAWSVLEWIDGETVDLMDAVDLGRDAAAVAGFIGALRMVETDTAPRAGAHNNWRGAPLAARDGQMREAIPGLAESYSTDGLTKAWERTLALPQYSGSGSWLHGDILSGNLLARDGAVAAVIDFGLAGVGDPACDLIIAWAEFDAETRAAFHHAVDVDADEWRRARGCALCWAVIALSYYQGRNPFLERRACHAIDAILSELGAED